MTDNIYFFDSYAIVEIFLGNNNYNTYTNSRIITTKLNVFEVYHGFLRDANEEEAERFLQEYYQFVIDFSKEDIKEAAKLKIKHKKRNLSMTDCIGFAVGKRIGIKFLTGDKEFEDFDNVEFVK